MPRVSPSRSAGPRDEPKPELVAFAFASMATRGYSVRMMASPGLTEPQITMLRNGHGWFKVNAWEWCLRAVGADIRITAADGQEFTILPQALDESRIDRTAVALKKMYLSAGLKSNSEPSLQRASQRTVDTVSRPWPEEHCVSRTLSGVVRLLAFGKRDPKQKQDQGLLPYQLSLLSGLLLKRTKAMIDPEYSKPGACPALDVLHLMLASMGYSIRVVAGPFEVTVADPESVRSYRVKRGKIRANERGEPKRPTPVTPGLRQEILAALQAGKRRDRIAAELQVAPAEVLAVARANGIPWRKRGEIENRAEIPREQIIGLLEKGLSRTEVARQAGVTRQRIDAIARSAGIPSRKEQQSHQAANALDSYAQVT